MPYPWIDDYLLQKPCVTKDLQPDWNWIRYQIGGKGKAMVVADSRANAVRYYLAIKKYLADLIAAVLEEVGHDHLCFLRNGIAMLLVVFEQRTRCLPLD